MALADDIEAAKALMLATLATAGSDVAEYEANGVRVKRFSPKDQIAALLALSPLVSPSSTQSHTTYAEVVT